MGRKGGPFDNYHNRAIETSSSNLVLRFKIWAIGDSEVQLSTDPGEISSLINRIVAAQRTCTLQWILAHVDIYGNEQAVNPAKEARNSI
ncbi:hypothetical protein TNCV_5061041 [Trichonephila clavipes]|nr:hypothetical protein TNCV_5061041 [Trichonephila clavipes]